MNKYDIEAKERWGETAAYQEYEKKTQGYTKERWNRAGDGLNTVLAKFAECMRKGHRAESAEAQTLVKELQDHITENFYNCTDNILAGLGQMYVCDERFKNNIDKNGTGTAEFVSEAITIYCNK